jgi:MarR family 2-MHQ and catechol resistance regulon transcriptional repressor
MTPPPGADETSAPADMTLIRRGIALSSERYGTADFDTINAVVTVKRTATDLENFAAGYCKQVDLSPGRLNVLMALNAQPEKSMALSDIGEYLVITRPNVTGLIDGLVADGLVKRIDHPEDRRMVLAQLTTQGREFMRKFVPYHHRALSAVMAGMTKQEKRQLVALLDKLRTRLREVEIPQLEEA